MTNVILAAQATRNRLEVRRRAIDVILGRIDERLGAGFYEARNRQRAPGAPPVTRALVRVGLEKYSDAELAATLHETTPVAVRTADPRLDANLRHVGTGQQYQRADLSSKPLHQMSGTELTAFAATHHAAGHPVQTVGDTWDAGRAAPLPAPADRGDPWK
jgi:hypothetical protein